jgi:hypothetical protein
MTGEDITLALIECGDWIGIDGRWCLVVDCASMNGWVSIATAHGHPSIDAAYWDVRIHLARMIDDEDVAQ